MQNPETILKKKLQNAKRIAVLGIGSDLRGDDVAGVLVAQQIEKSLKKNKKVKVFLGQTAPENLTGEIKKFQPTHLNPDQIAGTSFCTHMLPTKVMVDYLLQSFKFEVITIGIQPKTLSLGSKPSKPVLTSAKKLSSTIANLLNKK